MAGFIALFSLSWWWIAARRYFAHLSRFVRLLTWPIILVDLLLIPACCLENTPALAPEISFNRSTPKIRTNHLLATRPSKHSAAENIDYIYTTVFRVRVSLSTCWYKRSGVGWERRSCGVSLVFFRATGDKSFAFQIAISLYVY